MRTTGGLLTVPHILWRLEGLAAPLSGAAQVETTNSSPGPMQMSDRRPFDIKKLKTPPSDQAHTAIL